MKNLKLTASALRQDIYKIIDSVLETGKPVEIERRGRTVRIEPAEKVSKFSRLARRRIFKGDPDEIFRIDWLEQWRAR
ncbi:MAG: type II toxin-antitoxin system Phd/YefM family antitoxin [Deltaproteobacteria bacterium]|nr:type II toxin-antitoxin system Phd/YefM family antitoxin [Deltaproteobacteria bacterium]